MLRLTFLVRSWPPRSGRFWSRLPRRPCAGRCSCKDTISKESQVCHPRRTVPIRAVTALVISGGSSGQAGQGVTQKLGSLLSGCHPCARENAGHFPSVSTCSMTMTWGLKNQKGTLPTRYGMRKQLERCMAIAEPNGMTAHRPRAEPRWGQERARPSFARSPDAFRKVRRRPGSRTRLLPSRGILRTPNVRPDISWA